MAAKKKSYTKKPEILRVPFIPKYSPSDEQLAIFDLVKNSDDNIKVSACAGSGKSTTLVWTMTLKIMLSEASSAFIAFSKDIVNSIESNCALNVVVKTAHSFGYNALAAHLGRLFLMDNKVDSILRKYSFLNPDNDKDPQLKGKAYQRLKDAKKLIDMIRLNLCDETDQIEICSICMKYGIPFDRELIDILPDVFHSMLKSGNAIDFIDMIWMPVRLDLKIPQFNIVYVDECQDLSPLLIEFVRRMTKKRIILVGDRNQSIFGFAGADVHSFEKISKIFEAQPLSLNTCYRCGTDIISLAQTIVPEIKPWTGSHNGSVNMIEELDYDMPEGSMILCRRNAGLIKPCFSMLKRGKKAVIRGRNIGKELKDVVESIKATSCEDLISRIETSFQEKSTKILASKNVNVSALEALTDQKDIVCMFAEECETVSDILNKIDSIFSDDIKGVVLSSIHKSKGLEANHVAIIDYPKIRLNHEKMSNDDHVQEKNLHYVAITRAKNQLDLIIS